LQHNTSINPVIHDVLTRASFFPKQNQPILLLGKNGCGTTFIADLQPEARDYLHLHPRHDDR
jgi:ABC-type cobalamin/Fe3+-siderophores transport system ATPase subunit